MESSTKMPSYATAVSRRSNVKLLRLSAIDTSALCLDTARRTKESDGGDDMILMPSAESDTLTMERAERLMYNTRAENGDTMLLARTHTVFTYP